ncbi:hypothetical protein Y032_0546g3259 [Ancylostoma ceylanicum]|uniref:Uncharacterized protein n=1 Tax=Ancylostoma ceylanicum TaxID=53326 RepID=A0A016WR36_9BILA|nr:hypothetical protein Y032_0546g3259 [Ancylostoma ceylanicum]
MCPQLSLHRKKASVRSTGYNNELEPRAKSPLEDFFVKRRGHCLRPARRMPFLSSCPLRFILAARSA